MYRATLFFGSLLPRPSFSVPFPGVGHVHAVAPPSPLPAHLHDSFSSRETETLHPLNNNSPLPGPQALAAAPLLPLSKSLMTLVAPGKWNPTALFLCYRLISLSMMSSGFTRVTARVRVSFPFKAELDSTICLWHILFIRSSVGGCLCCFYLLAVVNNAAMNILENLLSIIWDTSPEVGFLNCVTLLV